METVRSVREARDTQRHNRGDDIWVVRQVQRQTERGREMQMGRKRQRGRDRDNSNDVWEEREQ